MLGQNIQFVAIPFHHEVLMLEQTNSPEKRGRNCLFHMDIC